MSLSDIKIFYEENTTWIAIITSIVLILGVLVPLVPKVITWRNRKSLEIKEDLKIRNNLESELEKYVLESDKNKRKDIAVRLIYFNDYSSKLIKKDDYPHDLWIEYLDKEGHEIINRSWIDENGVKFRVDLWCYSTSIYVDNRNIFFTSEENKSYKNFNEYKKVRLIKTLPFRNISSWDFNQDEPVFYIKYRCNNKKLYTDDYILREKLGEDPLIMVLNKRYQLERYSFIGYSIMRLKKLLITRIKFTK